MNKPIDDGLSRLGKRLLEAAPLDTLLALTNEAKKNGECIDLAVGSVDPDTIPLTEIKRIFESLAIGQLNYTPIGRNEELISAIHGFYANHKEHTGADYCGISEDLLSGREIVTGPSVTSLDLAVSMALANEGDYVIMADPWYYVYADTCRRLGINVMTIPEDEEGMNMEKLNEALARFEKGDPGRLAFMYMLKASNPKGTVMSNSRIESIVNRMADFSYSVGQKIRILADSAYDQITHPDVRSNSPIVYDELGMVVEASTVSKVMAPGLRTGWTLVSKKDPEFAEIIRNFIGHIILNPSAGDQHTVAEFFKSDDVYIHVAAQTEHYHTKAEEVRKAIETYLVPLGVSYEGGQAGFYYYLTLPVNNGIDSPFQKFLFGHKPPVLYVPGEFCVNPENKQIADLGKRQLRVSFGYETKERAVIGIEIMAEAIKYAQM